MRLHVDMDKMERGLTNCRSDGRFGWLMFPSGQTALTETVGMKAVLQHAWIVPMLFCLFVLVLFVALSFVITADLSLRLYQQVRLGYIYKFTLLVLNELARGLPIFFLLMLVFNIAIHLPIRWAWNRRAARLNYEASLPQPTLADATDIWPPPPTISASADTLPRI